MTSRKTRAIVFSALCVVCVVVPAVYLGLAARERDAEARNAPAVAQRGAEAAVQLAPQPHLIFRSTAPGNTYGRVGLVPLDDPASPRAMTALNCERVDFAGGHGICLQADRGAITTYDAVLFDERFRELATFPLAGAPSRARVSPDGRVAAYTVSSTAIRMHRAVSRPVPRSSTRKQVASWVSSSSSRCAATAR